MCGFTGIAWSGAHEPTGTEARVERMNALIRHRGPNSDGGLMRASRASVSGVSRSSILQPAINPSQTRLETIEVFLNGEIYNHRALRRELESSGRVFRTQSDAEVIPHLFEEHGIGFLTRLNGMYAIVICDHERGELYLCRDRLGIKPLYYGYSARCPDLRVRAQAAVGKWHD